MTSNLLTSALLIGSGLVSAMAATSAVAQSADDDAALGDIIVTARRVEERLQDVPIAITVFTQDDLSRRNISNLADLGAYTPALSTNSRFGAEKTAFAIRGFTQEYKTSPSVGVYFADVVGLRANPGTAGGNGAGVGELFDLQNVQVLKGPQGTLFGRNTTGGAILLVPNRPTQEFEGYVEGSLGNYDMRRLQSVVNVPVTDDLAIRGGVDWQKRDGYLRNRSGIGPDRLANVDYIAARLSVLARIGSGIENQFIASFSDSRNNGTAARVQVCDRARAATPAGFLVALACAQVDRQAARGDGFYDVENSVPDPRLDVRQWRLINTTTWEVSDELTLKNIISYGEFRERSAISVFSDNFTVFGFPLPLITLTPGSSGETSHQSTFTEELQLQGQSGNGRLRWVAGGYLEISRPIGFNTNYVQVLLDCVDPQAFQCNNRLGFGGLGSQAWQDYFDSYGLFAQATYQLTDKFSVTGGIRYTWDEISSISQHAQIGFPTPNNPVFTCQDILQFDSDPGPGVAPTVVNSPSQCRLRYEISSNKPTWLISGEYTPDDDLLLYAKWARGYRAGGINALVIGLVDWGPEKVDAYEVGAKATFRGAVPGHLNVAAYYNDLVDQQLSTSAIPRASITGLAQQQGIVNAGKSRIWGIEVDASVNPLAGLRFDLGYAYLNTKLISTTVIGSSTIYAQILPNAVVGGPLSMSPRHRVTLTGTYTLPIDESIGRISVGATYVYTTKQNSVLATSSPLYQIPSTDLLNLNASWTSIMETPIDASFFMTNVTKEEYPLYVVGGFPSFGIDGVNPNPPRMFGFRLRYRFGP